MVQTEHPEPVIVCDKCKTSETASEESADVEGWIIDRNVTPHKHFCPHCMRR
jgi:hypothetical protein